VSTLPQIDVGCAIIHQAGKILITKRHADDHLGGYWEFPGGKRESGETIEACLIREIQEELGVRIKIESFDRKIEHVYADRVIDLFFFHCRIDEGNPRPLDSAEMRWVLPAEFIELKFPPADKEIIAALHAAEN